MYHTKYKYIFKRVIPVILFVLIVTIFSDIPEIATSILDAGAAPRLLHFPAVWNYFSGRPIYFLFGGGPGSVFFTEAFIFQENGGWTDDSEISQLEALRIYGVFFTMYLLFLFVKLSKKTVSEGLSAFSYALWSFFLVAASNPVLLTTPAIIFYSITVVELTIPQLKKKRNGVTL